MTLHFKAKERRGTHLKLSSWRASIFILQKSYGGVLIWVASWQLSSLYLAGWLTALNRAFGEWSANSDMLPICFLNVVCLLSYLFLLYYFFWHWKLSASCWYAAGGLSWRLEGCCRYYCSLLALDKCTKKSAFCCGLLDDSSSRIDTWQKNEHKKTAAKLYWFLGSFSTNWSWRWTSTNGLFVVDSATLAKWEVKSTKIKLKVIEAIVNWFHKFKLTKVVFLLAFPFSHCSRPGMVKPEPNLFYLSKHILRRR